MASQATIMIGATDTQVVFEAGNTTYVSRRIEGVYPNYKQLIPDSCVTSVKIDVAAFNAALKRVAVIASANPAVKFEIDVENGQMGLSSISNDQDLAQETIDVEAEGESGTIAFNSAASMLCPRRRRSRWSSRATRRRASSSPTTRSTTCTWSCRSASSVAL